MSGKLDNKQTARRYSSMLAVTEIVIHFSVLVKLVYARGKRAQNETL